MIAYTGIETVSNLAEEARDPRRTIPALDPARRGRRLRDLLHAAARRALGAAGARRRGRRLRDALGQPPPQGFENDPVLGLVENLGLHGAVLDAAKIYVGILAATILFIATNAGVIGASRITYSMASYRQLPEVFRRLHPRFKTPWLVAARLRRDLLDPRHPAREDRLPRHDVRVRRDALVHVAHARIVAAAACRRADDGARLPRAAEPDGRRGVNWPLFAIFGGIGTGARLARGRRPVRRRPAGPGSPGSRSGSSSTSSTAAGSCTAAHARPSRAPIRLGPALALEYRTILVPIVAGPRVGRGDRPRLPPRRRAGRDDRRAPRDRGARSTAARRRPARGGGRRRPAARRGARRSATPTASA